MSFAILALGALGLAAAQTSETPKLTAACDDTVIFFARGNDAPYHDTRTTPFLDATCAKLVAQGKTCDYIDIQFDVTLGGPWCTQLAEGSTNGMAEITAFQKQCPCSHIVIGGYSEGAAVVGNLLAGGACVESSTGLSPTSAAAKALAAVVVWGDPYHAANQSYNVLDGSSLQAAGRDADSLARLQAYAPVLRNYCASGDPICAGGDNVTQHLDYFELYTQDAANWVVGKVDAAAPLCAATSSSVASSVGAAATSAGSVSAGSSSAVVSMSTPVGVASSAIVTPSGNASSIPIPVVVNPTSISTQYAVPVVVNTTSAAIPYANSTAPCISTPAPYPIVNGSATAYPTTIETVVPASSPANGGYAAGEPTTILTVVKVTSTKSQYATVVAPPPQESQGYAAKPPVAPSAPAAPKPEAPKPEAPKPEAPKASAPAPQVSAKPVPMPGYEAASACEVVTKTVYL